MRIDRYVHDERLTWGAGGVLFIITAVHVAGIGGLLLARPAPVTTALPPIFQVSLERLPPLRPPPLSEPEPEATPAPADVTQAPPRKTRPVPVLVDTPTANPVPPDTQVKPYEMGDELLEGEPGPPSPPGAVVGGTGEPGPAAPQEIPVVLNMKVLRMKPPVYPPHCLRLGIEGVVKVRALVGEDGSVQEATVSRSSGDSMLDRAALEAVHEWEFSPATRGGLPARAWVVVPIEFRLLD